MKRENILIEADELLTKIDDPNLRIFDATIAFFRKDNQATPYEKYLEAHLPHAAFFDHQAFSDATSKYMYTVLPENELAKQIGNIGISEDNEVIFYTDDLLPCATRAWWLLRYAGHNNVRILNGGIAAWKAAGGTIERGGNQYAATHFECNLRSEMFVKKEQVLAAMNDHSTNLVYTLPLEMYGGVCIPGSAVHPAMSLMQENRSFLPQNELTSQIKIDPQYQQTITYCGGGIAATVNAIAHLLAGNNNIAVYDGSLTEWMGEGLPTTAGQALTQE